MEQIPLLLMGGGTGIQAYSSYQAGKAAKEQYKDAATEEMKQAAFAQQMALEESVDVLEEGEQAKGATRARAGKFLRVGGSVKRQVNAISQKVKRRQYLINLRVSEQMRRHYFAAKKYKTAGQRAMKAGRYGAYASLLTGGAAMYGQMKEAGWFTKQPKDYTGTAHIGGYRPSSGYGRN